jgi:hypothetical protein
MLFNRQMVCYEVDGCMEKNYADMVGGRNKMGALLFDYGGYWLYARATGAAPEFSVVESVPWLRRVYSCSRNGTVAKISVAMVRSLLAVNCHVL